MNKETVKLYYYEWLRTGSIIKLMQLLMVLIFPVMLFILMFCVPVIMNKGKMLSIASAGYFVFIIAGIYSLIYKMESESRITDGFPIDYIPLRKYKVSLVHIIFTTILVTAIVYSTFYSGIFLIDLIIKKTLGFHSYSIIINILQPFFVGLPYIVLYGVITGSLLGMIGKKIIDNVSESMKKFVIILFFLLLFFTLKPYFSALWSNIASNDMDSMFFILSPINWSLIISKIASDTFIISEVIYSILFILIEIFLIILLSFIRFKKSVDINISYNAGNLDIGIVSPLWNIVIKKWFTLPILAFFVIWIIFVIISIVSNNALFALIASSGFLIYTIIALDRMIPSKNEDYKKLFEGLPISSKHIEGVFYGIYYLLYSVPMVLISYALLGKLFINEIAIDVPLTLSSIVLKFFPTISILAIIPILIMFHPLLWSSNRKGKKLKKRTVILYYAAGYFFIAAISSFAAGYYAIEPMHNIINKIFWGKGYYVGKFTLYSLTGIGIMVHIRAFILIIKSILTKH